MTDLLGPKTSTYASDQPIVWLPTALLLNQKQLTELHEQSVQELFLYMDFVYTRSRLLVDLTKRMSQKGAQFWPQAQHHTLMALQVAIFLRTLDQQIAYLEQAECPLPSGRVLARAALGPNLDALIQNYKANLLRDRQQKDYQDLLAKLRGRIEGEKLLVSRYGRLLQALNQLTKEPLEFYEKTYL